MQQDAVRKLEKNTLSSRVEPWANNHAEMIPQMLSLHCIEIACKVIQKSKLVAIILFSVFLENSVATVECLLFPGAEIDFVTNSQKKCDMCKNAQVKYK